MNATAVHILCNKNCFFKLHYCGILCLLIHGLCRPELKSRPRRRTLLHVPKISALVTDWLSLGVPDLVMPAAITVAQLFEKMVFDICTSAVLSLLEGSQTSEPHAGKSHSNFVNRSKFCCHEFDLDLFLFFSVIWADFFGCISFLKVVREMPNQRWTTGGFFATLTATNFSLATSHLTRLRKSLKNSSRVSFN